MRSMGNVLMSLGVIVISTGAVIMALKWKLNAATFPLAIGIPLIFLALAELLLNLFGKQTISRPSSDSDTLENGNEVLPIRNDMLTFVWIIGFFLLIFFFGFTIASSLMVFLYLKFRSKEGWGITLIFTASTWALVYGLFVRLLQTQFPEGWVVKLINI